MTFLLKNNRVCRCSEYASQPVASQPVVITLLFFLQFKEFELYWGAVFFTTRREVLVERLF